MPARTYTDAEFSSAVQSASTIAGVLKSVGLRPAGGNYASAKRTIQRLALDTTHFVGKGWSREQQIKDWSQYRRASNLKGHLLASRGATCEVCGTSQWRGMPVQIEVHHEDGDRTNNALANLRLLCPNCHAQTGNWRNRSAAVP